MEKTKEELTNKVNYSKETELAMSDEEIRLVNLLADKEPSCYADIAAIIIEETTSQSSVIKEQAERIEKLEAALREIEASCDNTNDSHEQIWSIAANALIK